MESEVLKKINYLVNEFNNSLNNNTNNALESVHKMRLIHGSLISKLINKKNNKKYLYLSSLQSLIFSINEKIIKYEKILLEKSDSSVSPDLALFTGEKSKETILNEKIYDELKTNDFSKSLPSLIFFFNPGCPACVKTKPIWQELSSEFENTFKLKNKKLFNILSIDLSIESNEKLAMMFMIEYIPTIVFMESSDKPSASIEKLEGGSDRKRIEEFIMNSYSKFTK
jgi:thiol-disulfide isomerase/thioredoxin